MDFNATIDLIIRELEEAREIIDDLKKHPGAPILQIELARSKCKNAGEVISLLKEMHNREMVLNETEKEPEKKETIIDLPYDMEPSEPVHLPEAESGEKVKEQEQEPGQEKESNQPVTGEGDREIEKPEKPFVAPIIADTFSHLANRFNEQVGSEKGDDYSYMQSKHISSLSESIGINDRFYFIRELFGGDGNAYSKAISQIEETSGFDEAKTIIMSSIKIKNENQALKQLLDLVKRKFRPNE